MNFAEQLVYWYLRLNGFFPITNFVLHQGAERRTSDADLVAVRFPHVSEDIGGNVDDWDTRFFQKWGLDITAENVGLFVEVKSGFWNPLDLRHQSIEGRLRDGLRRAGMIPAGEIDQAVQELRDHPTTRVGRVASAKLFVGSGPMPEKIPWLHIDLPAVERFVRHRMRAYHERKSRDRLFFAGDLIQYLAWKAGRPEDDEP